ncbi:beta-propeller domain-containing protein [Methanoregula sp.]|uniref:beta-propeller domain-containing protein n=1 Tax=Methanoregula sp. TaxID=2052170 RepID=UPI00236A3B5F|nr:beta-propeller domain-containing protein [Methanoregula sp.]MDD1686125.1 beta-propeller domain-containing protein [Methanoregula sp.]
MIQKNHFLIFSGFLAGLILAFAAMTLFLPAYAGTPGSAPAFQPRVQQNVTVGSGDLPQFSSTDDARAFLQAHTDGGDLPVLLTEGTGSAAALINGTRTWRFDVDTSTFKPDEYIITASAILQDATGSALFNVLDPSQGRITTQFQQQAPLPATNGSFITINPVGDHYIGDKFTITGRTNLAAGDEILVQVYSSSFRPTQKSQSGEFSGATGTVRTSASAQPVTAATQAPLSESGRKYSTTNVQVKDVDEADIVKTDGTYIYLVTGNRLHILKGYPAQEAGIISTLQFSGSPQSLYLDGDRLVLITSTQRSYDFSRCQPGACSGTIPIAQKTQVFVYSVKDPVHPVLVREMELDGVYKDTRMIGSMLYFVTEDYLDLYASDVVFPEVYDSSHGSFVPSVYYFDRNDRSFSLTTIGAVDIQATGPVKARTFLIGSAGTVYVSPDTLFIAVPGAGNGQAIQSTELYAFSLDDGELTYSARGTVDGTLLNQFSMDEYGGNLRVATTVQDYQHNGYSSRVTILDGRLEVIGSVGDLASGEQIYAARFMGDRLYLVTFRETDPLFVIDLTYPKNPKVLGELHIPGFSRYLHPYDATHLIGVGKESTWGGLKIALFDVTDVHNPRLVDEEKLGGYGSDSEVLRDHKAFLFDREKDLLVLPVRITEDNPSNRGVSQIWGGAYVFGVNPDRGFTEKGTVVHYRNSGNPNDVKRSFYIENVLYTLAPDKLVMSDLANGTQLIGEVRLG